jgi:hypothetical protein
MRETLSQSESFSDLPVSLRDKLDSGEDFDLFSPNFHTNTPILTQENLKSLDTDQIQQLSPTSLFKQGRLGFERQMHNRLENITEEESYELDNSKVTDRFRHSNKDIDCPSFSEVADFRSREHSSVKVIKHWPGFSGVNNRKSNLCQSTNILEVDENFGGNNHDEVVTSVFETGVQDDRRIFSERMMQENNSHVNFISSNTNATSDFEKNSKFSTNRPDVNLSPIKNACQESVPFLNIPVMFDSSEKKDCLAVCKNPGQPLTKVKTCDESKALFRTLISKVSLESKGLKMKTEPDEANFSSDAEPRIPSSQSATFDKKRKTSNSSNDQKPFINIIQNNNYYISINSSQTTNQSNKIDIRNMNIGSRPKNTSFTKTEEPKYNFSKKAKPFKEDSYSRFKKGSNCLKNPLNEAPKNSIHSKTELFKTKISKLVSNESSSSRNNSLSKAKANHGKTESATFDM